MATRSSRPCTARFAVVVLGEKKTPEGLSLINRLDIIDAVDATVANDAELYAQHQFQVANPDYEIISCISEAIRHG